MPAVYEHPHTVRADDIDDFGHANNLAYLRWALAASGAHSTAQGWPPERYREAGQVWVVRSHKIRYLRPAGPREALIVRTWVADMRRYTSLRKYVILRAADAATLARGEIDWAFIELSSGSPREIPEALAGAFDVVEGRAADH